MADRVACIGVLTSGGDSPGMNPAVWAVVRRAHALGVSVSAIHEGYAGLISGDIRPCQWTDVNRLLSQGGTDIGTARSTEFRTAQGRRKAVAQLVRAGIDRLVVIGGDGSLTGADLLRAEWSQHLDALVDAGELQPAQRQAHPHLHIVGLVGSIDNDMWGTDSTIGCDSALHRIVDAVDTLTSTARSHQRAFVVEVMGRHCGYLALAAALCTGADELLIPEVPSEQWASRLCAALQAGRAQGRRTSIVLVAEGACTTTGQRITAAEIKAVIDDRLGYDTRITVLGHTQRGGTPSAEDRIVPIRLGAQAVDTLLAQPPGAPPVLLTTTGNRIAPRPLMECVARTVDFGAAVRRGAGASRLAERGDLFLSLLDLQRTLSQSPRPSGSAHRVLVAHVGAPAPGMNAAVRAAVRLGRIAGHEMLGAIDGLKGAAQGDIRPVSWSEVNGISAHGATILGTDRWIPNTPQRLQALQDALARHGITGVVLIGGFEALLAGSALADAGVPVGMVPATISNNVPGTDRSVGCDTAVNVICEAADRLLLSAIGSRDRVFVMEVMGRRCGYLAAAGGLAAGASLIYTHEQGLGLASLQVDTAALRSEFVLGQHVGLVLVADDASAAYDARSLAAILTAESGDHFDTRVCVPGHLQQGGRPSPMDRLTGIRLAARALQVAVGGTAGLVVVGLRDNAVVTASGQEVLAQADRSHRRPQTHDHASLVGLARGLTLRDQDAASTECTAE